MAEATDGGLKCFVRVSMKVSGLEGPVVGHQQLRRKSAALWVAAVHRLPLGSAEQVG